jgi:preprotein translocase subunit SecB
MSQTVPGPQAQTQTPPLVVNIQYVKDMSFEVPNAPAIYTQLRAQPQVNINLDVNARRIQENQHVYEVTLMIRAEAREVAPGQPAAGQPNVAQSGNGQGGNGQADGAQTAAGAPTVFVAELAYAGVFTLNNLPENAIEPVLLVECPRILFPFARNILADVTRDGGFPPVLLQPIDFVALWQSRRQPAEATAQA